MVKCKSQSSEYTHLPQEEDIGPSDRSYRVQEKGLEYKGKKILYLVAETTGVTFFCDRGFTSHVGSIIVPGYIVNWQSKKGPDGLSISEVEPIQDEETQREIRQLFQGEHISNINFW
jgi:hypothetical protein